MENRLYVGNLPYTTTADELRSAFEPFGVVTLTEIIADRETGRSRGFGFVEMQDGCESAKAAMNGIRFQGNDLIVETPRPKVQ